MSIVLSQQTRRASVARHAHYGGFFVFGVQSAGMKYTKPALTCEQQADLLIQRGMCGSRQLIITRLSMVSYYRLSGYSHPFRCPLSGEGFIPGTTFEGVWARYAFDRRLRVLVMDAIERVEVSVRTWLAYEHAHETGPFGYATDLAALPELDAEDRAKFFADLAKDIAKSREAFVEHYQKKYGRDHPHMPIWMITEIMSFGEMVTLFRGSSYRIRGLVAGRLGVDRNVFFSWLLALNTVRNVCAHHSRLWNREFGVRPKLPNNNPHWRTPVEIRNNRLFVVLTILKYCLDRTAPQSAWSSRVVKLLSEYSQVPKRDMGFPDNWTECPFWTDCLAI